MGANVSELMEWDQAGADRYATALLSRNNTAQGERRCPWCNAIIYSRRHRNCGVCCEPLPAACVFTSEESAQVKSLLEQERQRHRKWLGKVNYSL